ncbi:hypothetical protein KI387_037243, partial [Taxus chinensis]
TFVLQEWDNTCHLQTQDSHGPSLLVLVEHFIEQYESNSKKMTVGVQGADDVKMIEQPEKKERKSEKPDEEKKEEEMSSSFPEVIGAKNVHDPECRKSVAEISDDANKKQPDTSDKTVREELEELKKDIQGLKDLVMKQLSGTGKNDTRVREKGLKPQNWKTMRSALRTYDVPMDSI